ncbi:hypothetical protein [Flavobacterium quisquiliarum]|uniref:Restriction endonuclease type IV Mrr domain-containing protein n=1 Tax=Flavobacterium quisquiliarum TaxID=1834436 RepID=A0ABV8W8P0_9FLAO|nr:hypothetical protein [Flavobacterium quisquiliarum]MBW1656210.1 hypothetical protein [Flavobacterium quisquiliarum]NWL02053.1 hypothetical protein [Flavobacterium collinsii]
MKSFSGISWLDFPSQHFGRIREEILSKGKDYILKIDEDEFIEYLIEKYRLEPLKIYLETESVSEPKKEIEKVRDDWGRYFDAEVYYFNVSYQFTGSEELFFVQPNPTTYTSYDINVKNNLVSFSFSIYKQDVREFNRVKFEAYSYAFDNLERINNNVQSIKGSFENAVKSAFQNEKNKFKQENDFFTAINVKINKDTESVFTIPTITKRDIPQPTVSKNKEFSSEPTMAMEMYNDVLKVIYDLGKSIEKKPSTYQGKDEEALRDQILLFLETRYEGTTATGETFNRGGKTDIILKYANDSSNLFVAECKFWHGTSEFLKAISQLFDRYLTWRDSKVALILFVTNKDFSNVLNTIKEEVINHEYYVSSNGEKGESSFSYVFRLPQDENKKVLLEIIAFHYDK